MKSFVVGLSLLLVVGSSDAGVLRKKCSSSKCSYTTPTVATPSQKPEATVTPSQKQEQLPIQKQEPVQKEEPVQKQDKGAVKKEDKPDQVGFFQGIAQQRANKMAELRHKGHLAGIPFGCFEGVGWGGPNCSTCVGSGTCVGDAQATGSDGIVYGRYRGTGRCKTNRSEK